MKDEPPPRLDRTTVMDGAVRRFARVDVELAQETAEADSGALVADSDSDRAILIVGAHCDRRAFEARIGHSRHCQQQLAGQEFRLLNHAPDNEPPRRSEQYLRVSYGRPKARLICSSQEPTTCRSKRVTASPTCR